MNKRVALLAIKIFIALIVSAQDQLVKHNGTTVDCAIFSIDSTKIEFAMTHLKKSIKTFVLTQNIASFKYDGKTYQMDEIDNNILNNLTKNRYKNTISFADSIESLNKNFILSYNNRIVFARTIDYEKPFLGSYYLQVDSVKYSPENIKFFKNETGFYANTKGIGTSGVSIFSERIRKGKINLYQKETVNYNPGYNPATGMTYPAGGGFYSKHITDYYNIGFGDLKKANYNNLYVDLANNPESVKYLETYKLNKSRQNTLYIIGGVTLVGGFATLINKTKDWDGSDSQPEPNVTANIVAIGAGAACFWVSYFINISNRDNLKKAIDTYNR